MRTFQGFSAVKLPPERKAGDCLTHNEQAFNGDPSTNPGGKNERLDREMEAERIRSTEKP